MQLDTDDQHTTMDNTEEGSLVCVCVRGGGNMDMNISLKVDRGSDIDAETEGVDSGESVGGDAVPRCHDDNENMRG